MLNQIIEVVNLDNAQHDERSSTFSIRQMANHNIVLLSASARHKGIDLNLSIDDSAPSNLRGNDIYLDRILLNLLGNAIKFTKEGHITLSISASPMTDNTVKLKITVEDTGIGIPQKEFAHIFEHFSRLNPSYEGIYKGNGLGLFTTKKCLDTMGGTIHLKSEEGKGTTFTVEVPLAIADATQIEGKAPEATPATAMEVAEPKIPESKNKTRGFSTEKLDPANALANVLVVEDNALASRMACEVLQDNECASDLAENGQDAIQKAKENQYDLILMDIGLPDMDGLEVARQIRQQETGEKTPIVALTGHLSDSKKNDCLKAGMQEMLSKPLTNDILRKALGTHVFSNDTLPTIDIDEGTRIAGGNKQTATELLQILASTLPDDMLRLKEHHSKGGTKSMYELIHKLYGGLCYCGTPQLRKLTKILKEALAEENFSQLDDQVNAVINEADKVASSTEYRNE